MSLSAKRLLLPLLSAPRPRLYSTLLLHPPSPSPPRLPPHLQAEFESLQRAAAESTEEVHPDARTGQAKPEFEGDVNPKTGEVGGPKNDPLRHGDWSFNGRVTDF